MNYYRMVLVVCCCMCLLPLEADEDYDSMEVLFYELEGVNLSGYYQNLCNSIPLYLIRQLDDCDYHLFFDEERASIRTSRHTDELEKTQEELSQYLQKRDDAFFAGDDTETYDEKIAKLRDSIAELATGDPGEGTDSETGDDGESEIPTRCALVVSGEVVTDESGSENPAFFIRGSLEEFQSVLFLTIRLESGAGNIMLYEKELLLSEEAMDETVSSIASDLRTLLLGREWCRVRIEAAPSVAEITIGEVSGVGEIDTSLFSPGTYHVSIRASGYQKYEEDVSIGNQEELRRNVTLPAKEGRLFVFQSLPTNSRVFIDSLFVGFTPLTTTINADLSAVTVVHEDYEPLNFSVTADSDVFNYIDFSANVIDKQFVNLQRRQYYDSLAYFMLSVPYTMVLFATAQNYETLASGMSSTSSNYSSVVRKYQSFYLATIGAVCINVGLLIDSFIELNVYMDSMNLK